MTRIPVRATSIFATCSRRARCAQCSYADCLADLVGRRGQDFEQGERNPSAGPGPGYAGVEYPQCNVLQSGEGALASATRDDAYATSYVGIGFYRDLDGHRLWTSTAQMFDERGKGLILRGARARTDRPGKHPYLAREDAYDLVKKSLQHYHLHHRTLPARIVIMKTSRFEKGEAEGFSAAIEEMSVAMTDMLWVSEAGHVMLLREGDYPSLRGSFLQLGHNGVLYTRGSVPFRHLSGRSRAAPTAPAAA